MEKEIEKLVETLECSIGDNEAAHSIYDQIIEILAKKQNPKLVAKLKRITKNTTFWYA